MPVFAFFAAGVTVVGGGFGAALRDPAAIGVVVGSRRRQGRRRPRPARGRSPASRAPSSTRTSPWTDVFGLSLLAGVGFTVSLLIGELAFGTGSERDDHVKLAVLCGSLIAALLATVVLRMRNRHYRLVEARETADRDHDGVPDVYETEGRRDPA